MASWSPDGSRIAVAQNLAGKIWLFDRTVDSTEPFPSRVRSDYLDLDWSPVSGRILAVANDVRGHYAFWTMRPDGSEQRKIVG